jgi:VIT1/CCC1 family predicted Fe2+/Mn2+ transporter
MLKTILKYADRAVFGSFDGMTVIIGILFSVTGSSALIFTAALGVGVAEGIGMAAGEWLSDSDNGFGAASIMGLATIAGALLPAIPFLITSGALALGISFGIIALVGLGIVILRHKERGWLKAVWETYGVLAFVTIFVVITQYLFGAK